MRLIMSHPVVLASAKHTATVSPIAKLSSILPFLHSKDIRESCWFVCGLIASQYRAVL